MTIDKVRMGREHEQFIAQMLGGRVTRGSGNQWSDPNDTRDNHHVTPFALSVQCKSTLGASIPVARSVVDKAVEEAGGELPAIALRFYRNERLDELGISDDWTALRTAELSEIIAAARRMAEQDANPTYSISLDSSFTGEEIAQFKTDFDHMMAGGAPASPQLFDAPDVIPFYNSLAELPESGSVIIPVSTLREILEDTRLVTAELSSARLAYANLHDARCQLEEERDKLRQANDLLERAAAAELEGEPDRERLPAPETTVVYSFTTGQEPVRVKHQGVRFGEFGQREEFSVSTLRVDRGPGNEPRLMVNDTLVRRGEWYLDGTLKVRSGFGVVTG